MKLALVALLVVVVRGRPQGSPQCGDVSFSCTIDQVLIHDDNAGCTCVGRNEVPSVEDQFAPNPDQLDQVNRRRKQVDQVEQSKPEVVDEQKPVTLPHQDQPGGDLFKKPSDDDKKKDKIKVNKEESSRFPTEVRGLFSTQEVEVEDCGACSLLANSESLCVALLTVCR